MKIEGHLRKYGYRPELSDGIWMKYEQVLSKHLGDDYEDFCFFRETVEKNESESEMLGYIGDDLKLLKIVFSGQIKISVEILHEIIDLVKDKNIKPRNVLDLGGADGWAIDYLDKRFNWGASLTVVDNHKIWKSINTDINHYYLDYSDFIKEEKYDLMLSLLGATFSEIADLLQCISKNISNSGLALLGLRISSERDYITAIQIAHSLGLRINKEISHRLAVFEQEIVFMVFQKEDYDMNSDVIAQNEILSIVRSCFHSLDPIKRVFGLEASILFDLIKNANQISFMKQDWDNGDHMELEILEKNGILYEVVTI